MAEDPAQGWEVAKQCQGAKTVSTGGGCLGPGWGSSGTGMWAELASCSKGLNTLFLSSCL